MSDILIDCCLMSSEQYVSYIDWLLFNVKW
jgi:hypothetical protein